MARRLSTAIYISIAVDKDHQENRVILFIELTMLIIILVSPNYNKKFVKIFCIHISKSLQSEFHAIF